MRDFKRFFVALLVLVGIVAATQACGPESKPYAQQIVIITGDGTNDSAEVKDILYPGDVVDIRDNEDWYLPGNKRNYIITPRQDAGDFHEAILARTGGNSTQPGADIYVTGISMFWALNQKEEALKAFFPFCQKYACAAETQKDGSGQEATNFSTEGWNSMLRENFSFAIGRAVGVAAQKFGPDLPDNRALWNDFAGEVSKAWWDEIGKATGWDENLPWFCDSKGNLRKVCNSPTFTIDSMQYKDESLKGRAEAEAAAARALEDARRATDLEKAKLAQQHELDEAKHAEALRAKQRETELAQEEAKKYQVPGYREEQEREHQERMMNACAQAKSCIVQFGTNGNVQVQS